MYDEKLKYKLKKKFVMSQLGFTAAIPNDIAVLLVFSISHKVQIV